MDKARFEWPVSVHSVVIFICGAAFAVCAHQGLSQAGPPRGYFTNTRNVGPLSGVDAHHFNATVSRDGLTLYFNDSDYGPPLDNYEDSNDVWIAERASVELQFGPVRKLESPLNTELSELLGSISEDGLTLYFSRGPVLGGVGDYDLFDATRTSVSEPFSAVHSLGTGVNTSLHEFAPFVSPDGLTIVYSVGNGSLLNPSTDVDVWMATRESTDTVFGNARRLEMNAPTVADWWPSLSSDGLALFTSDFAFQGLRPGSDGEGQLWVSVRESTDDIFPLPIRVDEMWPDSEISWHNSNGPYISPDWPAAGSKIYWAAQRPGTTPNSLDIYQADWIPYLDGDFNEDGLINGTDFLQWQRGESPRPSSQQDLVDWQTNYGQSFDSLVLASSAVPEPSTVLLSCFGLATISLLRKGDQPCVRTGQ